MRPWLLSLDKLFVLDLDLVSLAVITWLPAPSLWTFMVAWLLSWASHPILLPINNSFYRANIHGLVPVRSSNLFMDPSPTSRWLRRTEEQSIGIQIPHQLEKHLAVRLHMSHNIAVSPLVRRQSAKNLREKTMGERAFDNATCQLSTTHFPPLFQILFGAQRRNSFTWKHSLKKKRLTEKVYKSRQIWVSRNVIFLHPKIVPHYVIHISRS